MLKVLVSTILGLGISTAQAESVRYLVKFKSPTTFNSMVAQMRQSSPSIYMNPHITQFQMFNQTTKSTEALENIGLMIVESDQGVADLKNNPEVDYVEQEVMHPAPEPIGTQSVSTMSSKNRSLQTVGSKKKTIPMPWGIAAVKAPQAWGTTKGENSKVMVLDTGVDKDHPAIKANFTKGQNFLGVGAPDDVTDTVGHGTHVSGTILASGTDGGLVGVAPNAKLYMGRVCSTKGCSSIAIASGVNWAIEEGVQVVSLSLGGAYATPAEQEAFNNAEKANIIVIAASGNESADSVDFPAALPTVLAVGAIDQNMKRASFSNYGPEIGVVAPGIQTFSSVPLGSGRLAKVTVDNGTGAQEVQSIAFQGSPLGSVHDTDVVFCNLGKPEDFAAVDVKGKIALMIRGEVSFKDKTASAIAAGAAAVLIYNNADGLARGTVAAEGDVVAIPALFITQKDGEALKASLSLRGRVGVTMAVIATDYDTYQGTSMATPHVSGVAALIRSANPGLTAAQVRALIKDTATPLGPNDLNEYGSGIVNADAAVQKALSTQGAPIEMANGF
jgi:serine protease